MQRIFGLLILLVTGLIVGTPVALAQSRASVQALAGISTYQSEMLQGSDVSLSTLYSFGLSVGSNRGFMMGLDNEATVVRLRLNNSRLNLEEQEVYFVYRWSVLYTGIAFNRSQWQAKAAPDLDRNGYIDFDSTTEEYLNASNSARGLNIGLLIPIAKVVQLQSDIRYLVSHKVQQTIPESTPLSGIAGTEPILGRSLSMGPKLSFAFNASVDILDKALSLTTGYHYRSYQIKLASMKFQETYLTTYIGLQSAWSF